MDQECQCLVAAAGTNIQRLPAVPEVIDTSSDEDLPAYQAVPRVANMEVVAGQRAREHLPYGYMQNQNHIPGFLIPASVQHRSTTTAFVEAPFI